MHGSRFKTNSIEDRFWEKVIKTASCWNWRHIIKGRRYGQLRVKNKMEAAHRVSYRLHKGEIPHGLYVRHKCDNPRCVNPEHLELGTQYDNMQDAVKRGRTMRGDAHIHAKLTAEQVIEIRVLYATGSYTCAALAIQYGLSTHSRSSSTIRAIVTRKTWKYI